MNDLNKYAKRVIVIMLLSMAAWLIVMAAMMNFWLIGYYGWIGLAGGIVAFLVSGISIALWNNGAPSRDTTEINAMPYVVTILYLIIALVFNTIFCGLYYLDYAKFIPIAINLILLIIFIAMRSFMDPYREHVERTAAEVKQKVTAHNNFSALLSEIVVLADDPDEKQAVKKLQELVAYSPNMAQGFNNDAENTFWNELTEIKNGISNGADKEFILKKISEASKTWSRRNGVAASIK